MNEPTKEQIDRLPRWAKIHIQGLQRESDRAKKQLELYKGSREKKEGFTGKVALDSYASVDKGLILPDNSVIRFNLNGNMDDWENHVSVRISRNFENTLEVMTGRGLALMPTSSNGFLMKLGIKR